MKTLTPEKTTTCEPRKLLPREAARTEGHSGILLCSLVVICAAESLALALAAGFPWLVPWWRELPLGSWVEYLLTANVVCWTGGSYDTTLGYQKFHPSAVCFALAFAAAAICIWQRRPWGRLLGSLLWSIGLLAAPARLIAIRSLVPYSDSLGYQLDIQLAEAAIWVAVIPSAFFLAMLWFSDARPSRQSQRLAPGQISLAGLAVVTAITAVLTSQLQSLWRVYGQ